MNYPKILMILLAIPLATAIGSTAVAEEIEDPPLLDEEVSWEEAVEWAELVNTFVSPDGIEMEVYLDEVQGLMWEQPADEQLVGGEGGLLGRTFYMVPHYLYFKDDLGNDEYFYRSPGDITYVGTCGSWYCTKWMAWGTAPWDDVDTVKGKGWSYTTDWTADYTGEYWDLTGAPDDWVQSDTDSTYTTGGQYYYRSYEYDDPDGGASWVYANTRAIRFYYYDDEYEVYRQVELWYNYNPQ